MLLMLFAFRGKDGLACPCQFHLRAKKAFLPSPKMLAFEGSRLSPNIIGRINASDRLMIARGS